MPSLVTSIIGGIQGASAAHHAADAISQGYKQAGQTVTQAAQQVNPGILSTAQQAGTGVVNAATAAGTGATTAAGTLTNLLNPYISAGAGAAAQLPTAAQPFTADMMAKYSPVFQFQLQQGQQAAARAAAASGTTGSGGTAKALQQYAQNYAGTAFTNASNLYNQNFNRLMSLAGMGEGAATTAGEAGINAAEYAGSAGMTGAQYAGTANIAARNLASQNTLSAANYLANSQVGAQQAVAQGDLGAASSWNNMLSGIGSAANTVAMAGFGPGGWALSNIPTNFSNMWGGGGGGGGYAAPPMQWPSNYQPVAPTAFPAPQTPQLPSGIDWGSNPYIYNNWSTLPNVQRPKQGV